MAPGTAMDQRTAISDAFEHQKLLALASHDMRDPLSSLKLLIAAAHEELKKTGSEGTKALVPLLDRMMRQTDELTWLVGCLEKVPLLESNVSDFAVETADLTELVSATIQRAGKAAGLLNRKVVLHSSGAVLGRWHRAPLENAILHMLYSSLRSGASKIIAVRVGTDERSAWVSVEHYGPRVTESDGCAVFDQELLLSTARRIAIAMGASLAIERRPGEPAALKLSIPRPPEG
jgi:K+-sensing histidine kinase KdpD